MIRISIAMVVWVTLLTGGLLVLNVGRISPIEGAHFVESVQRCTGARCSATELPFYSMRPIQDGELGADFEATVIYEQVPTEIQAIFLPKFTDTISITLNGELLFLPPPDRRLWSTPLFVPIPPAIMRDGANTFSLTLSGPAPEGLELWAFYVGPQSVLATHYAARAMMGPGLGRFAMGLMAVLAAVLLLIWWNRKTEMQYFWLAASCLSAQVFLTHYAIGLSVGTYKIWTLLWPFSAAFYVICILKFLRHLLQLPVLWIEKIHISLIVACAVVGILLPGGYALSMGIVVNTLSAPSALAVLVILLLRRKDLPGSDLPVFFVCISIAVTLGVYSLLLVALPQTPRSLHLFQLMPLVMSFACLYLILSKFVQSLTGYEALTATLNETLDERTRELEESFSRLAKTEKREAIAEERNRIMLDLHDGLGGQLVNTLAYIRRTDGADDTVRLALEDALRDLALMLDSVETQDSLVTLLGMLRTRLEGLLEDHGIAFDWQIGDEPRAPFSGPSPNLHLARIVQEAITNVVKHADATTITVATNDHSITIADDGRGISAAALDGKRGGHGIQGMRRRSARIGATLGINRSDRGTIVTLTFDQSNGSVAPNNV